jgi:hypothetical protein
MKIIEILGWPCTGKTTTGKIIKEMGATMGAPYGFIDEQIKYYSEVYHNLNPLGGYRAITRMEEELERYYEIQRHANIQWSVFIDRAYVDFFIWQYIHRMYRPDDQKKVTAHIEQLTEQKYCQGPVSYYVIFFSGDLDFIVHTRLNNKGYIGDTTNHQTLTAYYDRYLAIKDRLQIADKMHFLEIYAPDYIGKQVKLATDICSFVVNN